MSQNQPLYKETPKRTKWEHKIDFDKIPDSPEIDKLEQDGWELVSVVYKSPYFYFYFKREKQTI